MAPEVLNRTGHSFPVDWWSLGVLIYEMIVGFTPFYTGAPNMKKMFTTITKKKVLFPDAQRHTITMTDECIDFISRLLDKNPDTRLGSQKGIHEILNHPWMSKISATEITKKNVEAPYKPTLSSDPLDVSCFDQKFTGLESNDTYLPKYR